MIYIIDTCKERLHRREFVLPIVSIAKKEKLDFKILSIRQSLSFAKANDKVIICGTGIMDNYFLKEKSRFSWILSSKAKILGICAGAEIIGTVFGADLKEGAEIGQKKANFKEEFLGLKGRADVFCLHQFYPDFYPLKDFKVCAKSRFVIAAKHRKREIYAAMFHPEVRHEEVFRRFFL